MSCGDVALPAGELEVALVPERFGGIGGRLPIGEVIVRRTNPDPTQLRNKSRLPILSFDAERIPRSVESNDLSSPCAGLVDTRPDAGCDGCHSGGKSGSAG